MWVEAPLGVGSDPNQKWNPKKQEDPAATANSPPALQMRQYILGWVTPPLSKTGLHPSLHSQHRTHWKPIKMKLEDTGTILLCDKETRMDRHSTEIRGSWKLTEQFGSEKVDALFTRCTHPHWITRWGWSLSKYNKLASSALSAFKFLAWTVLDKQRLMTAAYTAMTQDQDDAEISLKLMILACPSVIFSTAWQCIWRPDIIKEQCREENATARIQAYAEIQKTQKVFDSAGKKLHGNSSYLTGEKTSSGHYVHSLTEKVTYRW